MQRSGIACEYQYALFDAEYTCESQDPKTSEVYYMRKHAKINIIIRGASGRAQDMRNSRKKKVDPTAYEFQYPKSRYANCRSAVQNLRRVGNGCATGWATSSRACVFITCMRIHHMHAYSSHACVFITSMRIHHVHAHSSRACVFITCMRGWVMGG